MWNLKKVLNHYDSIMIIIIMIGLLIAVFFQILYRFTPNLEFSWSLELITYLFSWLTWMGIGIGIENNSHVGIELLIHKLSKKKVFILQVIHIIGFSVLLLTLCYFGGKALYGYIEQNNQTPAMHMPYVYYRMPIIFGTISGLFRLFQKVMRLKNQYTADIHSNQIKERI